MDAILVKIYLKNAVDKMTSKTILTNRNEKLGKSQIIFIYILYSKRVK